MSHSGHDHAAAAGHHDSPEYVQGLKKKYLVVFVMLALLTIVTVWISTIPMSTVGHITAALAVACVKATLVALYFMHLIDERKLIYWTLALCVVLFAALMVLPGITQGEQDQLHHQTIKKNVS